MEKPIVVILGPTCIGKTSLAMRLCRRFGGEVISADSRQIYKFMDVGTGKLPTGESALIERLPGTWKVNGVYVHLYDLTTPDRPFTVVDYAKRAKDEIESCWRRGKVPFLVGGTGFYIDVVLGKIAPSGVPPNPALRRELEKLSLEELVERLKKIDPKRLVTIDQHNKRRLVRALEVCIPEVGGHIATTSTRSGTSCCRTCSEKSDDSGSLIVGLMAERPTLYSKADRWAEKITSSGALEVEVRDLLARGYRESEPLKGIIYESAVDFVDGALSKEAMLERIKFDLHGYIRRQLTWFKRNKEIHWFDISNGGFDNEVEKFVGDYLDAAHHE